VLLLAATVLFGPWVWKRWQNRAIA
jgi:hypothetical protein